MKKKFINAKVYGHGDSSEILVEDGKFSKFGNNLEDADEVIDLDGKLVIPPYVDAHLHLDYYMIQEHFLKQSTFGMTSKRE